MPRSSAHARQPERQGVEGRISFEVASAKDYPGSGYNLVCVFDCLHDVGDPVGASAHVLETLDDDGKWMIVEPFAIDRVEQNLNPVGRVFYGASTGLTPSIGPLPGLEQQRVGGPRRPPELVLSIRDSHAGGDFRNSLAERECGQRQPTLS
jgi:hypothetical protein